MPDIESPPDHVLEKIAKANPEWTAADWEHWWCRLWMKRDPNWHLLPKCGKCDCWRAANA